MPRHALFARPVANVAPRRLESRSSCTFVLLGGFFRGQFLRGRRMAKAWRALGVLDPMTVARDALARTDPIVRETWSLVEPRRRAAALLCIPLIVLGNLVYAWALGVARAGCMRSGGSRCASWF